jgi:hypothetical protein
MIEGGAPNGYPFAPLARAVILKSWTCRCCGLLHCFFLKKNAVFACAWNRCTGLWSHNSGANCCLRCPSPRLYRPDWRVKADELNYWPGTSSPAGCSLALAHAKWTCSAQSQNARQQQSCSCGLACLELWSSRITWSTQGIIFFQSLQTSGPFPTHRKTILCYLSYVLLTTQSYIYTHRLYDTLSNRMPTF